MPAPLFRLGACALALLSCTPVLAQQGGLQLGAPGESPRPLPPGTAVTAPAVAAHPADVAFMQAMVVHHAQAVDLVGLIDDRTANPDLKALGRRIGLSQAGEIGFMTAWLSTRAPTGEGAAAPGHQGMDHGSHMHAMPGMLTRGEMAEIAAAKGAAFDRLFLEGMIRHHQGALDMVAALRRTPGAVRGPQLADFIDSVSADQSIEIGRMRALLTEPRR